MENKSFFRRVRFILPISLFILFISLPIGAQTDYPINVVTPNYIEARLHRSQHSPSPNR